MKNSNFIKNKINTVYNSRGFGLVEVLVVIAVIGVGFLAIISFLTFSRGAQFQASRNTEAVSIAEEGIEAVRRFRDESWTSNIAVITNGTTYYLNLDTVNGKWTLVTTNPGVINDKYTRTLVFDPVYRDASDNIAPSGTLDPTTKKLTVTVSWQEGTRSPTVTLTTYISNFLSN